MACLLFTTVCVLCLYCHHVVEAESSGKIQQYLEKTAFTKAIYNLLNIVPNAYFVHQHTHAVCIHLETTAPVQLNYITHQL